MMKLSGEFVPLLHAVRETVEKIGIFGSIRESYSDAVYDFVAFSNTEKVLCSEDSRIGWFLYS